jgi:hypothetical protein
MRRENAGSVAKSFRRLTTLPSHIAFAMKLFRAVVMIDKDTASALIRSQIVQHNRAALSSRPVCSECPSCSKKDWWQRKDMRHRSLWFLESCKTVRQVVVSSQAVTLVDPRKARSQERLKSLSGSYFRKLSQKTHVMPDGQASCSIQPSCDVGAF